MKFLKIYLSLIGLLTLNIGFSQTPSITSGLISHYNFDNCDAVDATNTGADGVVLGTPTCDCGVEGMAMEFDGVNDHVVFLGLVNNTFTTSNFTISFYFKPYNAVATQDLISKRENCDDDLSMLSIDYILSLNYTNTTLNEDTVDMANLTANLSPNCWQHYALTRRNKEVSVYINGVLKAQTVSDEVIDLSNNAVLSIANSPCIGTDVARFRGLIDELSVYNRALDIAELQTLYANPDEIANRDTIIFLGDHVDAFTTSTCAESFRWTPFESASDPFSATPTLTPEETTTYTLDFIDSRGCVTSDQLNVTVIDPATLDCTQIFLPKAFTPNGDGLNDVFFISNPQAVEELLSFEIYDRWGNRVFIAGDSFSTWDGIYNGKMVNPGAFYYKINYKCKGEEYVDSGSVTVLR